MFTLNNAFVLNFSLNFKQNVFLVTNIWVNALESVHKVRIMMKIIINVKKKDIVWDKIPILLLVADCVLLLPFL